MDILDMNRLIEINIKVRKWLNDHEARKEVACPFGGCYGLSGDWVYTACRSIFPELTNRGTWLKCPCNVLGQDFVTIRAEQYVNGELD